MIIPKVTLYTMLRLSSRGSFANVLFIHSDIECEKLAEWINSIELKTIFKPTKSLLNQYHEANYVFTFCPDCMSKNQFKLILPTIFNSPLNVLSRHKEYYSYENHH